MKKLSIKILSSMIAISSIASLSSSVVACHKNSTPSKNSWAAFKVWAQHETAPNLKAIININDLNSYHWKTSDVAAFSKNGAPSVSDNDQSLSATIIIANPSASDLKWPINLKIAYTKGKVYAIRDWTWSQDPTINTWATFKNKALSELASNLLAQLQPWNDVKKYLWTYGIQSQITWAKTDQAEFDTFGNLTAQDKYLGMAGKPEAHNMERTITAIISKKGKNGAYDSDPIKAIITYHLNRGYEISNWVFSKDIQLQSFARIKKSYNDDAALLKSSYNKFTAINWVTLNKDPVSDQKAIHHSISIDDSLNHANFSNHNTDAFYMATGFLNISDGLQSKIVISFNCQGIPHYLSLFFNYTFFNNKDIDGGLTAFNRTWSGKVTI